MTKFELGYLVGLIDGEAYLKLEKPRYKNREVSWKARLKIKMTDKGPLKFCKFLVGGSNIREAKWYRKHGWKPQWDWSMTKTEQVVALVALIAPFVKTRTKKLACKKILSYYSKGH